MDSDRRGILRRYRGVSARVDRLSTAKINVEGAQRPDRSANAAGAR
jgi:hypothetical protein